MAYQVAPYKNICLESSLLSVIVIEFSYVCVCSKSPVKCLESSSTPVGLPLPFSALSPIHSRFQKESPLCTEESRLDPY